MKLDKNLLASVACFATLALMSLRCASQGTKTEEAQVQKPVAAAVSSDSKSVEIAMPTARVATLEKTAPKADVSEFKAKTEKFLEKLPTIQAIRENRMREDHHDTPASMIAAGRPLGEVMDHMLENPAYVPTGLEFYESCAKKSDVVVQIKALCARNLRDWEAHLGRPSRHKFGSDVESLAKQLPKMRF